MTEDSDKLFVCGGEGKKQKALKSAEIYDSFTDEWTKVASMKVARSRCVAMEWESTRIGVVSGQYVQLYDYVKNFWYRVSDLHNDHVFPATGLLSQSHLQSMNRFLEEDTKHLMETRRKNHGHGASSLHGRPLPFVLGSDNQLGCLEIYDFRSDEWIVLHSFPHSKNPVHCMIECALNVSSANAVNRQRQFTKQHQQRRGSKIMGLHTGIAF